MGGSMVMVDKAEAFRAEAEKEGWEISVEHAGARVTVTATRGKEAVQVTWEKNACLNECFYTIDGKNKKLRNAAAAKRVLVNAEVSGSTSVPVKRISAKPSGVIPQPRNGADIDIDRTPPIPVWGARHIAKPDREILRLVVGKQITWLNSRTKQLETARVLSSPDQRQLRIEWTRAQKRVITFAAYGEGFRSLYLEAIVSVK